MELAMNTKSIKQHIIQYIAHSHPHWKMFRTTTKNPFALESNEMVCGISHLFHIINLMIISMIIMCGILSIPRLIHGNIRCEKAHVEYIGICSNAWSKQVMPLLFSFHFIRHYYFGTKENWRENRCSRSLYTMHCNSIDSQRKFECVGTEMQIHNNDGELVAHCFSF